MSSKLAAGLPRGLIAALEVGNFTAAELRSTQSRDRAFTRAFLTWSCGSCALINGSNPHADTRSRSPAKPVAKHTPNRDRHIT